MRAFCLRSSGLGGGLRPPLDFLFDEGNMSLPVLIADVGEEADLCSLIEIGNSCEFLVELGRSKGREIGFDVCDMDVHFGAPLFLLDEVHLHLIEQL